MGACIRYASGETVQVGDRVKTGSGHLGTVTEIIEPNSELAKMFLFGPDQGGILIDEDWNGVSSPLVMEFSEVVKGEEIAFIGRAKA